MESVTLLLNDSAFSDEALKLLQNANIPYEISPSSAPEVPCVRYKGNIFCGLGEIRLLLLVLEAPSKTGD